MSEITFKDIKPFVKFYRQKYRYPLECLAVLSLVSKAPGISDLEMSKRLDVELHVIKTVIDELRNAGKLWFGLDGRIFLNDDCLTHSTTPARPDNGSVQI